MRTTDTPSTLSTTAKDKEMKRLDGKLGASSLKLVEKASKGFHPVSNLVDMDVLVCVAFLLTVPPAKKSKSTFCSLSTCHSLVFYQITIPDLIAERIHSKYKSIETTKCLLTSYITGVSHIIMQAPPRPTDQAEPSIPPETLSNDANMNHTVIVHRKAANHAFPFDLPIEELHLVKKLRLEKHLPTTDEAAKSTASPNISVGLPPPAADNEDANADLVTDTQPNVVVTGSWILEEDAKLTRTVANTSKKKYGKEYKTDWVVIATLVPGRTKKVFEKMARYLGLHHRPNDVTCG
jgi:hypothetical protein